MGLLPMSSGTVSQIRVLILSNEVVGTVRNANGQHGTMSRAPAHLPPSMSGRQLPPQPQGPRGPTHSASSSTLASVNTARPLPRAPGSSTEPEYATMRLAGNEVPQRRDDSTPTKPVTQAHAQPWRDHVDDYDSDQDEDEDRHQNAHPDDDDAMLDGVIIPAIESVSIVTTQNADKVAVSACTQ